jgi:glycosyltransferase involved in cell wall biosynthesis
VRGWPVAYSAPMRGGPGDDGEAAERAPTATEAEAEAQHWRALAEEREAAMQTLRRGPLVRIAIGLERRARPIGRRLTRWRVRASRLSASAGILVRSGPARWHRARRRAALERVARPTAAEPVVRARVAVLALEAVGDLATSGVANVREVHVGVAGEVPRATLGRAAVAVDADIACLAPRPVEAVSPGWLAELVGALGDSVVAATPTLVHPARPGWQTTAHDQQVRSEGLELHLDDAGVPVAAARHAGSEPAVRRGPVEVDAAPLQCLVVDRGALEAAGGIVDLGDDDASAADLCERLRSCGGRIVHVPSAVVVDRRAVASHRALDQPIDPGSPAWRAFVERNGAAAARRARGATGREATRWVITTAVPSARIAPRWGDWHFAQALAASLRQLGEDVVVQTHDRADASAARARDLHLVLHGLAPVRRTAGQGHIVWVVSHPESFGVEERDAADLVVVASERFAEHLRGGSATPVEVLLQATDPGRFRPCAPSVDHEHPVTVVAKTRNVLRPMVADALAAGIEPAIYGGGWEHLVDPSLVIADHIDNDVLPVVYSSAGVVLNDHWDTMAAWGFVSNRIFDVLACGAPIVSDDVPEIHGLFGDAVPTYRTADELGVLVREILADPVAARERAAAGRAEVLQHHTFDHRARQLLDLAHRHGLWAPTGTIPA